MGDDRMQAVSSLPYGHSTIGPSPLELELLSSYIGLGLVSSRLPTTPVMKIRRYLIEKLSILHALNWYTAQRTKLCLSQLPANDVMRRPNVPRPYLLLFHVSILRHCDPILTKAKTLPMRERTEAPLTNILIACFTLTVARARPHSGCGRHVAWAHQGNEILLPYIRK
ncbi:hypothetical protein EVAR_4480_1 [Eumeta japonica]|uniref:Uncharacterized protein n=1 Tax=Eumeta variegata TaxID=151549 RepID=A0A4C1SXZ3_EUMVA|nr:hypothetical protein EVAR_4480_1 [Eumeta japonica]